MLEMLCVRWLGGVRELCLSRGADTPRPAEWSAGSPAVLSLSDCHSKTRSIEHMYEC